MSKARSVAVITARSLPGKRDGSHALISTKYQIVIPKEVRRQLGLKPGQRMTFINVGSIIHLVPDRPLSSLKGIAQGIDLLEGYRDKSDRP